MNSEGSTVLCKINFEIVKRVFNVSEGLKTKQFNEDECSNLYEKTDEEQKSIHETPLPYHVKIFQDTFQDVFS